MTEMAKTMLFVAAAVISLMIAFAMGPKTDSQDLDDLLGSKLNQFEVDVAKRLKIVKFDQETASTREFEVAEKDGLWTIPSKQGYPADAAQQMGEAATCLIDREVLRVAAKTALEHESLGVIDPNTSNLDSKAEGVGTRVTITDSNDTALADMIIGKPVKEAEGQYYVRNADQDVVYVVNLDPDKLSTKFDDWIEDDLLQLNPLDIKQVNLEDYSAEMQIVMTNQGFDRRVLMDQRSKTLLSFNSEDSKWQPEKLETFDPSTKAFVDAPLAEDEEINDDTMSELRDGLDDLLLVDVERKPEGLSSDLKASSDFLTNREALESLQMRGFIPVGRGDGEADIISSEGQTVCTLKNGVEYVLRFGNLKVDGEGDTETESTDTETTDETDTEGSDDGINRYLFVMARFNESMIPKPDLADVPELPAGAEEAADADSAAEEDSGETASEADATVAEGDEVAETGEAMEATEEQEEEEEVAEADADAQSEPASDDATDTAADAADEPSEEDQLAELIAERESIEKENQRKQDEYQDQIQAGKDRVAELNERFGDWYYVISNDVYKKISLSREDVVRKKQAEESADQPAAGAPAGIPGGIPGLPNLPINNAN